MKSIWTILWLIVSASAVAGCQKEKKVDPPHTVDEWESEFIGTPMGDYSVLTITINPEDDNLWFVTSNGGLYLTRDGGGSWELPFTTFTSALEIDPNDPSRIFVGSGNKMYLSTDYGHNWDLINSFPAHISSILVSKIDNSVYVCLTWEDSVTVNGIFKSYDLGKTWTQFLYNIDEKGIILYMVFMQYSLYPGKLAFRNFSSSFILRTRAVIVMNEKGINAHHDPRARGVNSMKEASPEYRQAGKAIISERSGST